MNLYQIRVKAIVCYHRRRPKKGFTLIELLLVIALIAILAATVMVSLNPVRRFAQARNARRWTHVESILNAVHQYAADNRGVLPAALPPALKEICRIGAPSCLNLVDLSVLTEEERYLVEMPIDPSCPVGCDPNGVGYTIVKNTYGRVTVAAPNAELGETISIKR